MSYLDQANLFLLQLIAAVEVKVNPDAGGLPGGPAAQKIINGAAAFALLGCVAAVIWGAAQWGLGSRTSNYGQVEDGKNRMIKGVGGAFAIGASAAVINFFFGAGSAV